MPRVLVLMALLVGCCGGQRGEPPAAARLRSSVQPATTPVVAEAPEPTPASSTRRSTLVTRPARDEDPCADTLECARLGRCSYSNGKCFALGSDDCKRTCFHRGACSFSMDRCVATSNTDCANSRACREASLCVSDGVECRLSGASEQDCRASEACRRLGLCFSRNGLCVAEDERDCARSGVCEKYAECSVRDGRCVALADACAHSAICLAEGRCDVLDGECVALTDRSCRRSDACAHENRCFALGWECVDDPTAAPEQGAP